MEMEQAKIKNFAVALWHLGMEFGFNSCISESIIEPFSILP